MITKNIVKLPKSAVEVQITVSWDQVEGKWNETLQRLSADLEIPGFRKGQAPLPMVEQNLGAKLQDEVFKIVFPLFLVEALQGSDIVPIDYPRYQLVSFIKGQPLSFKAFITERPKITIGDYKSIKATKPAAKVITDEDIAKVTDDLFKRWKARQAVQPQPTPESNNQAVAAGSLSFDGQNKVIDVPDDNFAKAIGAVDLNDLKTKLRTDLENEAKFNTEVDFEEGILQEVEKITTVDLPDVLVEDELNRMLVSLQRRVADMGLLLDDYLKNQGDTLEGIKGKWRPQAEKNVRMELGLAEIGKMENVDVTDQDVQAEVDKIQDAKLKAQMEGQEPRLHLKHSLRQVKTLDLLKKITNP